MKDFVIVLTASIDSNGCNFLERSDIDTRKDDYLKALHSWLTKTNHKIVFIENSNFNLNDFYNKFKPYSNRLEILQYNGNNYPRHLGKGYGEMHILHFSTMASKFIKNSKFIIKITGRLYIENLQKILNSYKFSDMFIVPNSSQLCIFRKDHYNIFSNLYLDYVNDSEGRYFEHALMDFCKHCNYSFIDIDPIIVGYSGTTNTRY